MSLTSKAGMPNTITYISAGQMKFEYFLNKHPPNKSIKLDTSGRNSYSAQMLHRLRENGQTDWGQAILDAARVSRP